MPLTSNQTVGSHGEATAAEYLKNKGYVIRAKNVRVGKGEIDIICTKNDAWFFVEVKSATTSLHFHPSQHFTHHKARQLRSIVTLYLNMKKLWNRPAQIDLIAIVFKNGTHHLEHFENVA